MVAQKGFAKRNRAARIAAEAFAFWRAQRSRLSGRPLRVV
jgi:hypothetical protein